MATFVLSAHWLHSVQLIVDYLGWIEFLLFFCELILWYWVWALLHGDLRLTSSWSTSFQHGTITTIHYLKRQCVCCLEWHCMMTLLSHPFLPVLCGWIFEVDDTDFYLLSVVSPFPTAMWCNYKHWKRKKIRNDEMVRSCVSMFILFAVMSFIYTTYRCRCWFDGFLIWNWMRSLIQRVEVT